MRAHGGRLAEEQLEAMKRHKHLWGRLASFDNLAAAARAAMRGKRSRPPAARFFTGWETEVARLEAELKEGSYRPGPYHYFEIHDPKTRRVAAAPFRDRVVHHALVRVLEPIFEKRFIEDSYACRKGKGTHAGMRRAAQFAKRYPYVLKCDVRRYFPSIDQEVMRGQLAHVIGDRRVLELADLILATHRDEVRQVWPEEGDLFAVRERPLGLPIGNLTSQFFANIYLDGFDHFVKQELRVKGYVRYVDDFLLFGKSRAELRCWGRAVGGRLGELGLEIHPDKYRLCATRHGVDFCGFVVRADGRIRVRSTGVRRFRRRYRRMRWEVKKGRRDAATLTSSVVAWVAHASHAQSVGLRRRVLGR
jgi:RNA-directed DNA polymerase